MLGYILASGEYFHKIDTTNTNTSKNMLHFFQNLNLHAIDMLEMLSFGGTKLDSNAIAGIGYITLTGFESNNGEIHIKANTLLAKELFNKVAGK